MDARRIAVVTGGTAGVGRAAVREFAAAGYDVAVLARGRAGLAGAVADVEARGGRALGLPTDVSDHGAVESAARRVEDELGEIDVWVNVAFAGSLARSWDTSPEEFRRMTEVSYFGQVYGTQAALEHMRPRDRGVVINVGSALAYRSIPLQSAYCGAKHAVVGYTQSVRTELLAEGSGVQLCMVQLPGLNTSQFNWNLNRMAGHPMPVAPVFQPELAGRGIVFLAGHPRRNLWVGFSTAYTILAERLIPGLLDRYLGRTGIASQQADEELPRWGSNVFEPEDDEVDRGSHGAFDATAHARDPWLWLTMNRRAVAAGAGAVAVAGLLARRARRR
ncbi:MULTISPECIES: SDR family oxidoreductase [unclassified Pseudactinotalea]|uniref:SDR family oxidoreductase n=1 Tax=unclassified Pseudactinotalea TaxID=2649176 RepID=UPI00128D0C38|nr:MULTISPECIES: SDR family oxidoreductase [unclassified Pseudactinotalea]MPV49011.1 SDR family NAD(P)-dependent oxidoreductase [Pseudactinotalea sp. HY160]QGH68313.1 SDR family NAD(P)-dependent oxidoreductase [Pseudactinotalea sp. HY158]